MHHSQTSKQIYAAYQLYRYTPLANPLSQIRLLHLLPRCGPHDLIRSRLVVHDLEDESVTYEALSYTWGSADKECELIVDSTTLLITANLQQALLRLRGSLTRVLWIDAVCINQEDLDERSKQVSLMRVIFGGAEHVPIWVGEDSEEQDGRLSLQFLASMDWEELEKEEEKAKEEHLYRLSCWGGTEPAVCGTFLHHTGAVRKAEADMRHRLQIKSKIAMFNREQRIVPKLDVETLNTFLARPWFSRRWVIQEAFVARRATLMCGMSSLPWPVLMRALNNTDFKCHKDRSNVAILLRAERDWSIPKHPILGQGNILTAMIRFEKMACQDDRDRIGAIITLWPSLGFRVDYAASVSENYCRFARCLVDTGHGLDVLDHAIDFRLESKTMERPLLPSWVPDWRLLTNAAERGGRREGTGLWQHDTVFKEKDGSGSKSSSFCKIGVSPSPEKTLMIEDVELGQKPLDATKLEACYVYGHGELSQSLSPEPILPARMTDESDEIYILRPLEHSRRQTYQALLKVKMDEFCRSYSDWFQANQSSLAICKSSDVIGKEDVKVAPGENGEAGGDRLIDIWRKIARPQVQRIEIA